MAGHFTRSHTATAFIPTAAVTEDNLGAAYTAQMGPLTALGVSSAKVQVSAGLTGNPPVPLLDATCIPWLVAHPCLQSQQ